MQRIFSIIVAFTWILCSYAANTLSLSSVSGHPGDELTVSVSLTNSDAVTALQASIPLGESLSYVAGSAVLNSARSNGHSLIANVVNGTLRIAVFSVSNAALKGSEGELLKFRIKLGNEPATYSLTAELTLAGAGSEQLAATVTEGSTTLLSPKIEVVTTSLDYGHIPIRSTYTRTLQVRNTGNEPLSLTAFEFSAQEFSVESEQHTIAAGQTQSIVITFAPTVHGAITEQLRIRSNAVNAHDVYGANRCTLIADPFSVNELRMQPASGISDDTVTVTVRMNNMEAIVGAQFSLKLPTALEYVAGSAKALSRAASHSVLTKQSNDTLTVILFSMTNAAVSGDDGDLLTLDFRLNGRSGGYTLKPVNTMLVNAAQQNMVSAVYQASVTIQSPTISSNSSLDFGHVPVNRPCTASYAVRNTGSVPLIISGAAFLSEGLRVITPLPIEVARNTTQNIDIELTPGSDGSFTTTMQLYTNDPNTRMKSVSLTADIYEPNALTFRGAAGNGQYRLAVDLANYSDIAGVQFDVEGLAPWTSYTLGTRAEGKMVAVQPIDDTHHRVIIFAMDNTPLSGKDGAVIEWVWDAAVIAALHGRTISMTNAMLVHPTKGNREVVLAEPLTIELVCTITFANEDGSPISSQEYTYGTMPVAPADPTKAATAEYTYTFAGWTPEIVAVTGDAIYKATFSATKNKYTITWLNDNDSQIDQTIVEYGVIPEHADASKAATAEYTYTFAGWDNTPVAVTGDAIYKATFSSTKNSYTITWLNDDNTQIDQTTVEYGVVPEHADATKENTAEFTYTFTGWDNTPVAVTGDATYKATFSATKNWYTITVTAKGWNEQQSLPYGTDLAQLVQQLLAVNGNQYEATDSIYTLIGWSPELQTVTEDAIYEAIYTAEVRKYTITWLDEDNTVLDEQTVAYGETPVYAGEIPTKEEDEQFTYTFSGWNPEIVVVSGEATYTATYTAEPKQPTAISDQQTAVGEQPIKIHRYGVLYIRRGDKTYTVQGQEVR